MASASKARPSRSLAAVMCRASAGRKQIGDRLRQVRANDGSLMLDRQESGREISLVVVGQATGVGNRDERRQIVGQLAQSIAEPGAHARKSGQDEAGVLHVAGRPVDVGLGGHRHQKGHVVDAGGQVRKDAAHPTPALAVLLELEGALQDLEAGRAGHRFQLGVAAGIEFLAVELGQARLVVEGVHRAGAAVHEQLHHAFHFGPVVQAAVQLGRGARRRASVSASSPLSPSICNSGRLPKPAAQPAQQLAPRERRGDGRTG